MFGNVLLSLDTKPYFYVYYFARFTNNIFYLSLESQKHTPIAKKKTLRFG